MFHAAKQEICTVCRVAAFFSWLLGLPVVPLQGLSSTAVCCKSSHTSTPLCSKIFLLFVVVKVWKGAPSWHGQRLLCSTTVPKEVTVVYQNGLPVISVSLPSRRERCQFTLKPLSDCVGVFLQQLQAEDRGIDRVAIYSMGKDAHTLENF
ncbi:hypothetical protein GOODEAATRI_003490 [Goodea atripinnis]|uniref:Calcium uniporter protein n=1 Tax=Goodea atripinnis TaxID=208336 RepID=A0ABV0MNZ7_9TELE